MNIRTRWLVPVIGALVLTVIAGCEYGGDTDSPFDRFTGDWTDADSGDLILEFEDTGNYFIASSADFFPSDFGQWEADGGDLTLDSDEYGLLGFSYDFDDFWQELVLSRESGSAPYLTGVTRLERQ